MKSIDYAFDQPLLADRLKALWADADAGLIDKANAYSRQQELIAEYAQIWEEAMKLPAYPNLKASLCNEIATVEGISDINAVEQRCRNAMLQMKEDWEAGYTDGDEAFVVEYYDKNQAYIYELMWWHTLEEDKSPLAYVSALHLARKHGCRSSLDFGSGVGSGAVLFSQHGISVALADISSTLLNFAHRRLDARGIEASYIDLKTTPLPPASYDFISAMDVFEHIAEPEKSVDILVDALRPGGIIFGRFAVEDDDDRPSHIAKDFTAAFQRFRDRGLEECWRDEWLWGHQAFRLKA